MDDPQGQDGTVMRGAGEVLLDEGVDVVEGFIEGEGRIISIFIRSHERMMRQIGRLCQIIINGLFSAV